MGRRVVVDLVVGEGRKPGLADRAELLRALGRVAADPQVRVLRVEIRTVDMGLAATQALREAFTAVRSAGKRVVVRMDAGSDRSMYLASAADEVWMPPGGELHLTGLAAPMLFFGPALSRLGLDVQIEAAGVYKSFGEPFFRGYPTRANRDASTAMLEDLHAHILETIGQARGLAGDAVTEATRAGPFSADQAYELGLVDKVGYADELDAALEEHLGGRPRSIDLDRYMRSRRLLDWLGRLGGGRPQVGVLYLQGPVVERAQRVGRARRLIASDAVVPVLDALRENARIRAVVLVIDSPGGSALASDLIARAVERLEADKPVVVAMESVAASGGYYISAPATEVVARETTLTGSIGVIGGKIVVGGTLGALGVHAEQVGPGVDAGMNGAFHGFTDDQRRRFRASLRRVYDRFIAVVATGRDRTAEEVLEVAEGRVWTGRQAQEQKLVDHLGGLPTALERVRSLADLGTGELCLRETRFDPPKWGVLNMILGRGGAEVPDAVDLALRAAGPAGDFLWHLRTDPMQAQALEIVPWDTSAWESWR
jgi:protease-4